MKNAAMWLYRRWGQIACFSVGMLLMFDAASSGSVDPPLGWSIAGGFCLFTGVGLKAVAVWKEALGQNSN